MGFAEDIESILEDLPADRQTVLFSATMPGRIGNLVKRHLTDPVRIEIERATEAPGEAPRVTQRAFIVPRSHKPAALGRVLDVESPEAAIVFCRTRNEVDQLTETMNGRGYRAEALHGGLSQEQRDRVMGRVRSGSADLLVATDVAARGLDVEHLSHVVNYDVPSAPEAYVHRIGRVGRAGREGVAITLAEPREHRLLKNIERVTGQRIAIEKVPSIADLQNRRIEMTLATLRETLAAEDLDGYRVVVETLADEFDVMEVALAAVKLAHEAGTGPTEDEQEIPDVPVRPERDRRPGSGPGGRERPGQHGGSARPPRRSSPDMTRLFIGAGRAAGIRPKDLVGAIAGESGLAGREIGAIEIADRFSLVEVPSARADDVIAAMKRTTIKGRKATIRRERS
jgi:ATP-dependent RNA helicase DeaD